MTSLTNASAAELEIAVSRVIDRARLGIPLGGYGGRSQVYSVGSDAVVKVYSLDAELKSGREVRAYDLLAGRGLPIPRKLAQGRLSDGTPWLLLSRLPGEILAEFLDTLPLAQQCDLFGEIGALLARLHATPIDDVFAREPVVGLVVRYPARLLSKMRQYAASARETEGEVRRTVEAIERWLDAHPALEEQVPLAFMHGDYSARNVLVSRRGGRDELTGIIDFEKAYLGEPARDIAKMFFAEPQMWTSRFCRFCEAYVATGGAMPSFTRFVFNAFAIVLDAATWAPQIDPEYFQRLVIKTECLLAAEPEPPPGLFEPHRLSVPFSEPRRRGEL